VTRTDKEACLRQRRPWTTVVLSVLVTAVVRPLTGTPQLQRLSAAGCTGRGLEE